MNRHPLLVWVLSQRAMDLLVASDQKTGSELSGGAMSSSVHNQTANSIIARILLPIAKLGHPIDQAHKEMLEGRILKGSADLDITHFK